MILHMLTQALFYLRAALKNIKIHSDVMLANYIILSQMFFFYEVFLMIFLILRYSVAIYLTLRVLHNSVNLFYFPSCPINFLIGSCFLSLRRTQANGTIRY